ncbi:MAG: AraC family transcriptional regulator [Clostridia bacterium]|nr:AraC family transcriptional regulator [Clostridia bacterium]
MVDNSAVMNKDGILFENVRQEKCNDFFCFVSDFDRTDRYHRPIIESHFHAYIEVIYIFSGELKVTVNDKMLTGTAGDMFVIVPSEVHSFERKKGCKYICIQVDPSFIFSGIMSTVELKFHLPFASDLGADSHLFKASVIDSTEIPKHIQTIVREYQEPSPLYRLAIRTSLSFISLWVLRQWEKLNTNPNTFTNKSEKLVKLTPVLEILNKDFNQNIKAEQMAALVNMSSSYFSRFFNSAVGMGFTEYLNFVRINESERLIVSTDYSIAEIAQQVGFANTSYFITQFKKQFQISPKKYRQQYYNRTDKNKPVD